MPTKLLQEIRDLLAGLLTTAVSKLTEIAEKLQLLDTIEGELDDIADDTSAIATDTGSLLLR